MLNPETLLTIRDLHLNPEKQKSSYFCNNFKFFGDNHEKNGGVLFGIIELNATPGSETEIIYSTITRSLEENYFQQINSSPDPQKLNIETVFEFALNRTNQRLLELVEIGQIKLVLSNLNYFVGVARTVNPQKVEIFFADKGPIKAFLLHRNKQALYQIININPASNEATPQNDKIKVFSNITSGEITPEDTLIVCTEIFNNFISAAKIKHILTNNPLAEAINYFRSQVKIAVSDSPLSFSALFIKQEAARSTDQSPISQKSLDRLIRTTEKTEKLLTPTFTLNLKKNWQETSKKIKTFFKPKTVGAFMAQHQKQNTWRNFPKALLSLSKHTFLILIGKQKISIAEVKTNFNQKLKAAWQSRGKLLAIVVFSCFIILIGSIFLIRYEKQRNAAKLAYNTLIEQIQTEIISAETNLIVQNKNQSLNQLQAAQKNLAILDRQTTVHEANYQELDKKIQELKNKLLNIQKVIPQLVANFSINGEITKNKQMILAGSKLYNFGSEKSLLVYNLEQKKLDSIIDSPTSIQSGSMADGKLHIIGTDQKLYRLDGNTLQPTNLAFTTPPTTFQLYNGNLYAFDKVLGQINKYPKTDSGFGSPVAWIKNYDNSSLTTTAALAIDGTVYLASQDGRITKFYAGTNETFDSPIIEPKVQSVTRLFTATDSDLYLFEATSKRLIVINKKGEFVKQLSFESLPSTEDLTLDFTTKTGYILTAGSIYQFSF